MRNELLGYLLGALEKEEQAQIESKLRGDDQLHGEMEILRRGLAPLEQDRERLEPPADLWRRTVEYVLLRAGLYGAASTEAAASVAAAVERPVPAWSDSPVPTRKWRFVDVSVAAGIVVAAMSVVVPAVIQSRANAERVACQNRLKDAHAAIASYAEMRNGKLPMATPGAGAVANAGIYGPMLVDAGHLKNYEALVCPGSDLARENFAVPRMKEIENASGDKRKMLVKMMGGSYAIVVGYWENGRFHARRLRPGERFLLMADMPGEHGEPIGHHGGCGRNVIMSDGSYRYTPGCCIPGTHDRMYLNDDGEPDAGDRELDFVVLPGYKQLGLRGKMMPVDNTR
jgi:anti-sigma-K factor RskA